MADLYAAKEAAKAVELYADHIENVMRDHLDMTGLIGSMFACILLLFSDGSTNIQLAFRCLVQTKPASRKAKRREPCK